MIRSTVVGIAVVLLLAKAVTGFRVSVTENREDVQKFDAKTVKAYEIVTDNGRIEFTGTDSGTQAEIRAVAQASAHTLEAAREALQAIEVVVDGKDQQKCRIGWRWTQPKQADWSGTVNFNVRAPGNVDLVAKTDNGSLAVKEVTGTTALKSRNGSIEADTRGERLEAYTQNGRVDARFAGSNLAVETQNGEIKADLRECKALQARLSTQNGGLTVTVGRDTSCKVEASTVNGSLRAPSELADRRKSRRSLSGVLGGGQGRLTASSVNGSVRIRMDND
jgi:hypothetical protein